MNIVGNNGDYYDTVRINGVSFELGDRYAVTAEHYLNHAHIICSMRRGFPCMSLFPDVFGQHAIEVIRGELSAWEKACRS